MVRGCVNLLTAVFFLSESLSLDVLSLSLKFRRSKILKMHLECMHLSLVLSLSLSPHAQRAAVRVFSVRERLNTDPAFRPLLSLSFSPSSWRKKYNSGRVLVERNARVGVAAMDAGRGRVLLFGVRD